MFSALKEFESSGLLNTNETSQQILQSDPGMRLMKMNPIKTFHSGVVTLSCMWVLTVVGAFIYCLRSESINE